MRPDDFKRLVAAGLSTDQIAIVMEMMDRDARLHADAEEARKAKGRDRVAKWREARNVTEMQPKVTVPLTGGDARVEDKTSSQKIEPLKTNTHTNDLGEFRSALTGVCDENRVDEFVKLRRKKRGTLTGHSAKLFLADAAACGLSVPDAIDTCISRNWITVKPEFLAPKSRAGPQPTAPKEKFADGFGRLAEQMERQDEIRSEASSRSISALIPDLSVVHGGRR